MTDITAGVWAKDRRTFEMFMAGFGLGTFEDVLDENGEVVGKGPFVPHPHLLITGGGFSGWSGILTDPTGETDQYGFPVYAARPGIYFNCRALDITNDPQRKSLARNLRHRVMPDGSEVKYSRFNEDGTLKPLLERTRLVETGIAGGGQYTVTVGESFDRKMPRRVEIRQNGELVFAAYSLEDGDIATPTNVWA